MFRRRAPELERLRSLAPFQGCSARQLEEARRNLTPISVPEGQRLVRRGQVSQEVFLLVAGEVTVRVQTGGEVRTEVVGPGALVGEAAVVDGGRHEAEAETRTEVEVYVCTPREFEAVLAAVPALRERVRDESRTRRAVRDEELLRAAESEWMRTRVGREAAVARGIRELEAYLQENSDQRSE